MIFSENRAPFFGIMLLLALHAAMLTLLAEVSRDIANPERHN
jgi:hypothetical protein